jgi:hypothetical protein
MRKNATKTRNATTKNKTKKKKKKFTMKVIFHLISNLTIPRTDSHQLVLTHNRAFQISGVLLQHFLQQQKRGGDTMRCLLRSDKLNDATQLSNPIACA